VVAYLLPTRTEPPTPSTEAAGTVRAAPGEPLALRLDYALPAPEGRRKQDQDGK
jgi:hypothetical protein